MRINNFVRECVEIKIGLRHLLIALLIGAALFAGGFVSGVISNSPTIKFLGL